MIIIALVPCVMTIPDPTTTQNSTNIQWGPCANSVLSSAGGECGFLSVPLDYTRPNHLKIQLAISRIRHTVPDSEYQGIILVNPGGPGGSGLIFATRGKRVPNNVGEAYDWIGFDPRGVGSSKPALSCMPDYFRGPRPDYEPSNDGFEKIWLMRSQNYAIACALNNSELLPYMTTIDVAKDIESIRIALFRDQINYLGYSYGTYIGQVYATLFPQHVRRMILDSNVDPRAVWFQANLNQDLAFERNIKIWFSWLAKYDNVFHLGQTALQIKQQWNRVIKQLKKSPYNNTVGSDEWLDIFLNAGYFQRLWISLGTTFAQWVNQNDGSSLISWYEAAENPGNDNGFAVYLAVQCTDTQWPQSWNFVRTANWRTFAEAPTFTWLNAWYNGPCQFWTQKAKTPVNVDGSQVSPILLIDETLDAPTPFEGSLEVRRRFPRATLLAVPNGTNHGASLRGNNCVDNIVAQYLLSGTLPPRKLGDGPDLECAPLPEPVPTGLVALTKTQIREELRKHRRY
ncbi:unnamed protein product [Rotaria sp. Silwood1]|nr:unnamed protein product [Rotaria sp. Silwood1]